MSQPASPTQVSRFRIDAMCCAVEEGLIRRRLEFMPGITALDFNLIQRVLTVRHELPESRPILQAIRSLRFEPVPLESQDDARLRPAGLTQPKAQTWIPIVSAGLLTLGAELAELFTWLTPWLPAILAIGSVALSGWKVFWKGWISIASRNLNINALMSIAVTGAIILQLWPEAAMVMVLFALAERIEGLSLERARKAISSLVSLAPSETTVAQPDGTWKVVLSDSVRVGSIVRVRPGERISHDAVVTKGTSTVDQSPITGESVPVDKVVGDAVFAGTINQYGELEIQVTALTQDSTLSRITRLVEEAQNNRAPTQRFVDQFARVYTPLVFAIAVMVALIPPLVGWGPWFDWIYKSLVLMIIACPCALVISTPVTIVCALAAAAGAGILVKGGTFLEQGKTLQVVAFDKTGTITHGRPELTDFEPLAGSSDELLAWAVSLASRSDHPVSLAVARAGIAKAVPVLEVSDFRAVAGRGVQGTILGKPLLLGKHRWVEELGICTPQLETRLEAFEAQGRTIVVLAETTKVLALFALADTVKDSSREAVAELHALGVKSLMLSGDNEKTVQSIAKSIGIDDARGEQLPGAKLDVLGGLSLTGQKVAMVGDGINDAPALARADIGFAMGGVGTGTAIETADVVLMDDDLRKVPQFISLSRKTSSVLVQNIALALGIKAVFFGLTVVGLGTMWMAVFADMGTSLLVVFNGLRLLSCTTRRTKPTLPKNPGKS